MNTQTYLLRVLTPLHVGSGTSLGYVDLPIYREAHTDFPAIPSTSIKGVLRSEEIKKVAESLNRSLKKVEELMQKKEEEEIPEEVKKLRELFGVQDREGELAFLDAKVLLFPVKSLRGIFSLVTCPYVIRRFLKDLGMSEGNVPTPTSDGKCIVFSGSVNTLTHNGKKAVVLEEFTLEAEEIKEAQVISSLPVEKERIVIVSDNLFKFIVKNYTEVQTHIKVDLETGTVKSGALWTEEYVPAETVFYFQIKNFGNCDYEIEKGKVLQLGGNSSTGKGFVEVIKYENA